MKQSLKTEKIHYSFGKHKVDDLQLDDKIENLL